MAQRLAILVRASSLSSLKRSPTSTFPDIEPHGIKDDRVREFVRQALFSGDSSTAGIPSTPGGAVLEHRWLAKVVREELKNIHQPTLIVHPREDDYADLSNAWYLQRHLRGIVDMVVLDDCYHVVTIDRQRHVVVDCATTFVETVTKRAKERAAKAAPKGMEDAPHHHREGSAGLRLRKRRISRSPTACRRPGSIPATIRVEVA